MGVRTAYMEVHDPLIGVRTTYVGSGPIEVVPEHFLFRDTRELETYPSARSGSRGQRSWQTGPVVQFLSIRLELITRILVLTQ